MRSSDLVGAWRELGRDYVGADGRVKSDPQRSAQIMYSADGYMSVVSTLMERARVNEKAAQMDLDGVDAAERARAASDVVAYAGRFEVKDGVVHHKIDTALNPNLVGTTQTRKVILDGDDLTLRAPPDADGNFVQIRWRRATKM